jgi:hypothetical protein
MLLKFYDEAFLTAAFLINCLPTPVLTHSVPIEKLFNTKPAYSFLRTFGCAYWPNLRPYNTHKLAFQSKQCAFLGYSTHHKGYKCLDIATGHVYISRDVIFNENVFLFASLHANAGARLRSEISLLPTALLDSTLFGIVLWTLTFCLSLLMLECSLVLCRICQDIILRWINPYYYLVDPIFYSKPKKWWLRIRWAHWISAPRPMLILLGLLH